MNAIIEKINRALSEASAQAAAAGDAAAVEQIRIDYLGRNGLFPALSKEMGSVAPEERKETGRAFNEGRNKIQAMIDEATAMLDPRGRADVLSTIEKLNRDFGTTVIHITHYMEEAIRADRVIVIDDGKIKLDGTPREVFSEVEAVKSAGLDVPQVTELMLAVKNDGFDIPTDVLTFTEGADAVEAYILQRTDKKDHS